MSELTGMKPGDWVRFYRDSRLVIGVVQYLHKETTYPYAWNAETDIGSVRVEYIREVRPGTETKE